jgi:hypothetical protein
MPATRLHGPHNLTADGVASVVKGVGPGAYVLGTLKPDGVFYVSYVGRSDGDLAARLLDHVPKPYPHFKYGFYPTALGAFTKECQLYHDFGQSILDNECHPAKPKGTSYSCPVPNCGLG